MLTGLSHKQLKNHLSGLNLFPYILVLKFTLEVKFFGTLDTFTWTKLELSVMSYHLSWRNYSTTDALPS